MNKATKTKIAVFYGGKITRHLVEIREAAKKLGVNLDLISYNQVCFESGGGVKIRNKIQDTGFKNINDYGVVFFRTTGKHWEEVDLINHQLSVISEQFGKKPVVVDPMVEWGKPSMACKAWQMLKLSEAGIAVPKTVYGSLWYLLQFINDQLRITNSTWRFPVILKGSGGDRGTRVYRANDLEGLEKLVRDLRKSETEEGRRYMLQEWVENEGDYRVLVLGEKVLGVMKRVRNLESDEYRNNFSAGGRVEVADLPPEAKKIAIEATKVCGLMVAGVDLMPKDGGYLVLEVNKGPQFKGFMKATGIDVPQEIVKFLVNLSDKQRLQ